MIEEEKNQPESPETRPVESTKKPEEYEPEYYEPSVTETRTTTNVIGWIVAIVLLALAVWLLWIALT